MAGLDLIQGLIATGRSQSTQRKASSPIPFTLVTGFLGSGKTSLINAILSDPQGIRHLILVNDFGSINIDAALIRKQTDSLVQLENGCACCSLSAGLANALAAISELDPCPQSVVMEASGLAEPSAILLTTVASGQFVLNAVVSMVDSCHFEKGLKEEAMHQLLRAQVEAADILVLNKADLVTSAELALLTESLRRISPAARVYQTVHGRVPPSLIFDRHDPQPALKASAIPIVPSVHGPALSGWTIPLMQEPVDPGKLETFAKALPVTVFRAKGLFRSIRDGLIWSWQFVGARWSIERVHGASNADCGFVFFSTCPDRDRRSVSLILTMLLGGDSDQAEAP
ncbi:MAG TPA: GTP-binding protein [Hyphomonas sp.]|nr:GTP-binding protein [Hyphomonas sp.]